MNAGSFDPSGLASAIDTARGERGTTMAGVAREAGVAAATIRRYEFAGVEIDARARLEGSAVSTGPPMLAVPEGPLTSSRLPSVHMDESPYVPVPIDSSAVRALVVEAVDAAAELMSRPSVGAAWDQPSALEGMTVGGLAAHLVRAAGATIAYLDRTPGDAEPEGDLLTPVTYFHAAVDSPIHERIKQVSADESAIGHETMATKCSDLAAQLRRRLAAEPADRLIGALGGRMLTLDDFCRTRLIEVLLHLDDLAVSVGESRPETDPLGAAVVIDILESIARHVHGDWKVIYALARSERVGDQPVFPVF